MNKINLVYTILYKNLGKQGWWPLTIKGFNTKHHVGRPKTINHKFEIIIGAILTQNTNWKNVEKALYNLAKNNLIDIKKINKIKKEKLAKLIKPSGYYNQKADRLKIIAKFLIKNPIRKLNKLTTKELREKLLNIKGIGPETADSILLYAFEKPIFVIDAYTKRIFERLGFKKDNYDEWQELFMKNLKHNLTIFKEYHALIVEQGKNYCKNKPLCNKCPLDAICSNI